MDNSLIFRKCAAQHFGIWIVETEWFQQTFMAVRAGLMPIAAETDENNVTEPTFNIDATGIAHIPLIGMMTKGGSSYGGASTVRVRQMLRMASADKSVSAILLHVDSNGGTVAGTAALADDMKAVNAQKPVYAHIEDSTASAAYWIASQARRVTAERTSLIGSIGTFAYIVDTSGEFEKKGWVAHVISTGKYKGMGADGTKITDEELAYIQERVDNINEHFIADIATGRNMDVASVRKLADGRVHDAEKAKEFGLIDAVQSIDDTVNEIRASIESESRASQARYAIAVNRR